MPVSTTVMAAVIYNAAKVSAVPATYQDLLGSQYKGEVGMNDPSQSGPTFPFIAGLMDQFGGTANGVAAGESYLTKLKANGLQVFPTNGDTLHALETGADRLRDDPELRRDRRGDQGHEERDVRSEGRLPAEFNAAAGGDRHRQEGVRQPSSPRLSGSSSTCCSAGRAGDHADG